MLPHLHTLVRIGLATAICAISFSPLAAQNRKIDSLKIALSSASDTAYINTLNRIANEFMQVSPDSSQYYANEALQLSEKQKFREGNATATRIIGTALYMRSDYDKAMPVLEKALKMSEEIKDSNGIASALNNIGNIYWNQGKYKEALVTHQRALSLREKLSDKDGIVRSLNNIGSIYLKQGNYSDALNAYQKALSLQKELGDKRIMASLLNNIGNIYWSQADHAQAITSYQSSLKLREELGDKRGIANSHNNLGSVYLNQRKNDKATEHLNQAMALYQELHDNQQVAVTLGNLGLIYLDNNDFKKAADAYQKGLDLYQKTGDKEGLSVMLKELGALLLKQKKYDEAEQYARKSLQIAREINATPNAQMAARVLSEIFIRSGKTDSALLYVKLHSELKDSLVSLEFAKKIAEFKVKFESEKNEKEIELLKRDNEIARLENEKWRSIFLSVFGVAIVVALFSSYRYRVKRRAEKLLQEKNASLEEKTKLVEEKTAQLAKAYDELSISNAEVQLKNAALEKTLADLSATQQQLVQQEKLAALGELVAGVAHEIQNPLNFVNNFSELSAELCDEIKAELQQPNANFQSVERLVADIESNLEKISRHGMRASAIVKSMLEHSRLSSGEKQDTDLNALLKEYLKLSLQSYHVKHHGFNIQFTTELDESIGRVAVMPREISQVFLNVFNNAFYAMREKASQAQNGYAPTLHVQTHKAGDKIEIRIRDNGTGVSAAAKQKIFQPFFTTKKSGDGTGLGLSISNDIIKAHGGAISVESKEGEYAEFIIALPTT